MITSYRSTKKWPYTVCAGGVVFTTQNQVLILSRTDNGITTYHVPKGTLEPGEGLEDCARREILEESGADVELVGYLGVLGAEFTFDGDHRVSKITHHYVARLKSPSLKEMDSEHMGRQWVELDEAENLLKLNANPKQEWLIIERFKLWLSLT